MEVGTINIRLNDAFIRIAHNRFHIAMKITTAYVLAEIGFLTGIIFATVGLYQGIAGGDFQFAAICFLGDIGGGLLAFGIAQRLVARFTSNSKEKK